MRIISHNTEIHIHQIPSEEHFNKRSDEIGGAKLILGKDRGMQCTFHSLFLTSKDESYRTISIFLITEENSFEPLVYFLNENEILIGYDIYITCIDRNDLSNNKTIELPFYIDGIIEVPSSDLLVFSYETGIACYERSLNKKWEHNAGDIISELVWDNGRLRFRLSESFKKARYIDIKTGKRI